MIIDANGEEDGDVDEVEGGSGDNDGDEDDDDVDKDEQRTIFMRTVKFPPQYPHSAMPTIVPPMTTRAMPVGCSS